MKLRIDKTSRRTGFHKLAIPSAPKFNTTIKSKLGPIKMPKMPKVTMPKMYGFK